MSGPGDMTPDPQSPDPKPAAPRKTGRGLRVALALSLALNLLIVGVIAGAVLSGRAGERGAPRGGAVAEMSAVGLYGRALSREDRRAVGRALRRNGRGEGLALRRELRDLAQEAVTVLEAEPFEAERFAAILKRQQSLIVSRSDAARDVLLGYITDMTPEARRAYAEGLRRALSRGPSSRAPKQ